MFEIEIVLPAFALGLRLTSAASLRSAASKRHGEIHPLAPQAHPGARIGGRRNGMASHNANPCSGIAVKQVFENAHTAATKPPTVEQTFGCGYAALGNRNPRAEIGSRVSISLECTTDRSAAHARAGPVTSNKAADQDADFISEASLSYSPSRIQTRDKELGFRLLRK